MQEFNKDRIRSRISQSWNFVDNYPLDNSGRIWVGWDPEIMFAVVIHSSSQSIFLDVTTFQNKNFVAAFVYGSNDNTQRRHPWNDLRVFAASNNKPWILLGDFNSILEVGDKVVCADVIYAHLSDFRDCIQDTQIFDLSYSGCFYTWSNQQVGDTRIASKIDRMLVNMQWLECFAES